MNSAPLVSLETISYDGWMRILLVIALSLGIAGGAPLARAADSASRSIAARAERAPLLADAGQKQNKKKHKKKKAQAAAAAQSTAEPTEAVPPGMEPLSTGRYIAGGIVGTVVGFGIGHAIEGRYVFLGLMFTVVEAAAYAALIYSLATLFDENSSGGSLFVPSLAVFIGFHIWEIVSVWVVPRYNGQRYVQDVKATLKFEPEVIKTRDHRAGVGAALTYQW